MIGKTYLFRRGFLCPGRHQLIGELSEDGHVSIGVGPESLNHFLLIVLHEELVEVFQVDLEVVSLLIGNFLLNDDSNLTSMILYLNLPRCS
jgi:hypothetical protein